MSYYDRGGDLISLNEEIWPSVAYFWCEDPLAEIPLKIVEMCEILRL